MKMARRPKAVTQMTAAQFDATFPDEDACKTYLQKRRWPECVRCPRCGHDKVFPVGSMPFKWQCYNCTPGSGYRFSVIAGTIFENTNKPLKDWFRVTHLMLASKKSMSALQIQRMLGFGSYGTAHSMCHKIRAALIEPEAKLGGIVEVDETYIGGKWYNKHRNKRVGGTGGIGSGKIGAVHTNTIEGFWSILKRGVVGTFHKVSKKYMPLYVAEFQFRYNNRHNPDIFGAAIAGC